MLIDCGEAGRFGDGEATLSVDNLRLLADVRLAEPHQPGDDESYQSQTAPAIDFIIHIGNSSVGLGFRKAEAFVLQNLRRAPILLDDVKAVNYKIPDIFSAKSWRDVYVLATSYNERVV
jgi:hypothetical protein